MYRSKKLASKSIASICTSDTDILSKKETKKSLPHVERIIFSYNILHCPEIHMEICLWLQMATKILKKSWTQLRLKWCTYQEKIQSLLSPKTLTVKYSFDLSRNKIYCPFNGVGSCSAVSFTKIYFHFYLFIFIHLHFVVWFQAELAWFAKSGQVGISSDISFDLSIFTLTTTVRIQQTKGLTLKRYKALSKYRVLILSWRNMCV